MERIFFTKPVDDSENIHGKALERNLSLFDVLCVGVGGTIGTGVFVLSGLIAREYVGPSAPLSFLVAGFACLLSAASYAELSAKIPSSGSSYAYTYATLGELLAVISAWTISLEYGVSASAVARSWGDKMNTILQHMNITYFSTLSNTYGINIFGGILQFICMILLLFGADTSKWTINIFTAIKLLLITLMIVVGLMYYNHGNMKPFIPYGVSGIFKGATSCFFGFIGFDEVCCMAGETKNPQQTLPYAVFGTITIVTFIYCLSALALVGMRSYEYIHTSNGFSEAFLYHHQSIIATIVSIGEIVCLPLVVLVSFVAQPRIQYAMASDGLLPALFAETDQYGNLKKGILISGIICTFIAIFVPFNYLDDMISAGVLISFNMTNTALIVLRYPHLFNTITTSSNTTISSRKNDSIYDHKDYTRKLQKRDTNTTENTYNTENTDNSDDNLIDKYHNRNHHNHDHHCNNSILCEEDDDITQTITTAPLTGTVSTQPYTVITMTKDYTDSDVTSITTTTITTSTTITTTTTNTMTWLYSFYNYIQHHSTTMLLINYHISTAILSACLVHLFQNTATQSSSRTPYMIFVLIITIISIVVIAFITYKLVNKCHIYYQQYNVILDTSHYLVPYMPYIPLSGIFMNYILLFQLSWNSLIFILFYCLLATLYYFLYCYHKFDTAGMKAYIRKYPNYLEKKRIDTYENTDNPVYSTLLPSPDVQYELNITEDTVRHTNSRDRNKSGEFDIIEIMNNGASKNQCIDGISHNNNNNNNSNNNTILNPLTMNISQMNGYRRRHITPSPPHI